MCGGALGGGEPTHAVTYDKHTAWSAIEQTCNMFEWVFLYGIQSGVKHEARWV